MHDIRFRAWDKLQKCYWIVGSIHFSEGTIDIYKTEYDVGTGLNKQRSNYNMPIKDRFILEQYTGLKDKNGKKDWLNDIVETKIGSFTYRCRIVQAESGAYCISLPTMGATGGESLIMLVTSEHVNIGNIHENPEMLK